ncbi:MAG: MFS transporter [Acidimicrobiia bacterium]|nr:MFS transporter [Acidimicrobiia bacterium]
MSDEMRTETRPPKRRLGARYWRLWTASVISNLGDGIAAIAYPWLASAVTRNGLLIALIAVAQRLPWLVFTLPAGVITDRVDRRKLIASMDVVRFALTLVVALVVLVNESGLPSSADLAAGVDIETDLFVYLVLVGAALLFGFAEVLRDNAAQTILPALVEPEDLEKANGNLWGAEMVANSFVGPPLGSFLLGITFALPFFVDAGTFAVAAALVFLITGQFRAQPVEEQSKSIDWTGDIKEGFMWLWRHPVLRPLAIVLGFLNALGMMIFSTFILFAQEELDLETGLFTGVFGSIGEWFGFQSVGALIFAILLSGGAIGGIIGSVVASRVSQRLGSGPSLYVTILTGAATAIVIGFSSRWWMAFLMFAIGTSAAVLWNVITVSLRQTIIPDHLLGRVNSVYRFFGWGMMPIGSALGGLVMVVGESIVDRPFGLRLPYFVVAGAQLLLFLYAAPRLTTEKMEAARAEGLTARQSE